MAKTSDHRRLYDITGYCFTDESLIRTALTHSSYASEHRLGYGMNNERLEFIGDAFVTGENIKTVNNITIVISISFTLFFPIDFIFSIVYHGIRELNLFFSIRKEGK